MNWKYKLWDWGNKATMWGGILFGLVAAWLWLLSARVPVPVISLTWDADFKPFVAALQRQSDLSGWAAVCTGASVLCQAIAQYLSREYRSG